MPQLPDVQNGVPWVVLQMLVHPAQWDGSVARLISQPLDMTPSQFP